MRHILEDHHKEHIALLGVSEAPDHLDIPDDEYQEHYQAWRVSLPHASHEELHKRTLAHAVSKRSSPIGTNGVAPHIVQDAKLTESRAIRNHLRDADIKHFPALKKELDDIEDETRKAGLAVVEAVFGLSKAVTISGDYVSGEVKTLQSGVEKLAADSREDFSDAVKLAKKFGWAIVALLSLLILSTLFAPRAHGQFSKVNSITFQQDGTPISGAFFSYPFTINCTVNVTCTLSSGKLTINSSGGGGSGDMIKNSANVMGASGTIDGTAMSATTGLTVPIAAGAAPVANGTVAFDSTKNQLVFGETLGGSASTGTVGVQRTLFVGSNASGVNVLDASTCTGHPTCVHILGTASGTLNSSGAAVFPANYWTAGKIVSGYYVYQVVGAGTPANQVLSFRFQKGGVTNTNLYGTQGGFAPTAGQTASMGGSFTLTCTATGASGSIVFGGPAGTAWGSNTTNSTLQPVPNFDTTAAQTFQPLASFGASTASNTQQLLVLVLVEVN